MSGDIDGNGAAETRAVRSLQVGVVTSDMGAGGFDVPTCVGELGDDGKLLTEGNTFTTGCVETYPAVQRIENPADADERADFASNVRCVLTQAASGCGLEQPLESGLKALTPSTSELRFANGTSGHGDDRNEGLVREGSVLAVVLLTDADDCSAEDRDLFNPDSTRYDSDLPLRCVAHPDALFAVDRYVNGFLALRRDTARFVFGAITGVPRDLLGAPGDVDYARVLADDRMQPTVAGDSSPRIEPSCSASVDGATEPPRRVVRAADELDRRGAHTALASLCDTSLDGGGLSRATPRILRAIGDALGPASR